LHYIPDLDATYNIHVTFVFVHIKKSHHSVNRSANSVVK